MVAGKEETKPPTTTTIPGGPPTSSRNKSAEDIAARELAAAARLFAEGEIDDVTFRAVRAQILKDASELGEAGYKTAVQNFQPLIPTAPATYLDNVIVQVQNRAAVEGRGGAGQSLEEQKKERAKRTRESLERYIDTELVVALRALKETEPNKEMQADYDLTISRLNDGDIRKQITDQFIAWVRDQEASVPQTEDFVKFMIDMEQQGAARYFYDRLNTILATARPGLNLESIPSAILRQNLGRTLRLLLEPKIQRAEMEKEFETSWQDFIKQIRNPIDNQTADATRRRVLLGMLDALEQDKPALLRGFMAARLADPSVGGRAFLNAAGAQSVGASVAAIPGAPQGLDLTGSIRLATTFETPEQAAARQQEEAAAKFAASEEQRLTEDEAVAQDLDPLLDQYEGMLAARIAQAEEFQIPQADVQRMQINLDRVRRGRASIRQQFAAARRQNQALTPQEFFNTSVLPARQQFSDPGKFDYAVDRPALEVPKQLQAILAAPVQIQRPGEAEPKSVPLASALSGSLTSDALKNVQDLLADRATGLIRQNITAAQFAGALSPSVELALKAAGGNLSQAIGTQLSGMDVRIANLVESSLSAQGLMNIANSIQRDPITQQPLPGQEALIALSQAREGQPLTALQAQGLLQAVGTGLAQAAQADAQLKQQSQQALQQEENRWAQQRAAGQIQAQQQADEEEENRRRTAAQSRARPI